MAAAARGTAASFGSGRVVAAALAGVAGPVGSAAPAGPWVIGAASPGAFTLGSVGGRRGVGARAARTLAALGRSAALSLGGPAALPVALGGFTLGWAATRTFGGSCPLGPVLFTGVRPAAPSGAFVPGRDSPPLATAAARTVDRAIGPSTTAFGTPSSFGTHVVLDCLSRPVGLTIPWWKRGSVPLGDR